MKRPIIRIMIWILIFILGGLFIYHQYIKDYESIETESLGGENNSNHTKENEVASPGDWIKEEDINVYDDHIKIDIQDAKWAGYLDTNSMDPVLDHGANGIYLVPESADELNIGDIIVFPSCKKNDSKIVHRIIDIEDTEEYGKKFITKGDNNKRKDSCDIYFKDIQRVLIGILY